MSRKRKTPAGPPPAAVPAAQAKPQGVVAKLFRSRARKALEAPAVKVADAPAAMAAGLVRHRLARLLVALPSARMGGTERHTAELCTQMAARTGMAITLAAEPSLHAALGPLAGPGVTVRAAALGWATDDPVETRAPRQAAAMRELIETVRPDAVFVPLPWPDAGNGLLPVLAEAGLPRLVLLHLADDAPAPPAPPALGLEGAVVAAVSAPVARRGARAWGVAETSVALLANPAPRPAGLDRAVARAAIRSGLGLPAGGALLLFVGRLEAAKGADLLPDISLWLPATIAVAGDGPLRPVLEARAAEDPAGCLRMLGPLADPRPWYLAADALLLPSRLEGMPLVFLEAAAHRCPVVATAAALEGLGADAPRFARIAATPDAAGIAAAAGALLDAPGEALPMIEAAAAHAARQRPEAALEGALGLLRAAVLRAGSGNSPARERMVA